MLKVTVHNAERIPSVERFTDVDPMVTLIFQGIKKQTNWQRSTCDPKWDETLDFPLNGIPIQSTDTLEVHLKDHETIGANKLIGQGTIPLIEVVRNGMIKRRTVQLTNPQGVLLEATKLYMTLEYIAPIGGGNAMAGSKNGDLNNLNQFDDVPLHGNDTSWQAELGVDQGFRRQNKVRSTKPQDFQIRVKIFQARQLDGSNLHPVCRVRVINSVKQTKIRKGTNQPYFDEVFFFNINMSEAEMCDETIEFEVCNSRTLRSDMKIGTFKMDLGYIHAQAKHSINRKWLLLSDEGDRMAGAKGYLKVSVNILGPGDEAPSQENGGDDDDIESNLLKPAGLMLRPATFILKVFKADDLPRMDSAFLHGVKKIFHGTDDIKELIDPYVNFSFAGQQVSSKIIYTSSHPEFNQELRLGLKFPSMCDKLTITVMDWDRLQFDDTTGSALLHIKRLCDDRDNGFLPTFGPCWINLYGAPREYSEMPTALDELNSGKGEGVAYRGRVFVELQTILGETPSDPLGEISNSDLIRALPYQARKKYKLHAAFLDASMLYEHESMIEFEMSIGNYGNKLDDVVGNASCSTTPPTNPVFDGCAYYFLPWGHTKPCVQVASEWEDVTFRLEAMNQLSKLKLFVTGLMSTLDLLKIKQTSDEVLVRHYKQSLDMVIAHLKKPLPNPEIGRHHTNELDRLRRQMRDKDLVDMIKKLEQLKLHSRTPQEILDTLEDIRETLEYLEAEPQNSIPDVIIWLLSNGKRYAYYRIPANEVFYSTHVDRRGRLCGKVQTITMKWPGKEGDVEKDKKNFLPAEIRVKIWLGLAIHEQDWLSQQKGADLAIYAETYENQTNVLGQWTSGGPLMTRPAWSDVTGNTNLPKKNFQLPPGWRWEGDWYISPEISARYANDAGHRKFTEEVYEHQYRLLAGAQWQPRAVGWTDLSGDKVPSKDERTTPPEGWTWEDEWTIDANRAVDEEGYEYCVNQTLGGWCPTEKVFHLNRRRRWFRPRVLKLAEAPEEKKKEFQDGLKNGWEYAPMFNMKFHADERSMDMTRRRRWHRKMVPDGTSADSSDASSASSGGVVANTDIVFRMQSQVVAPIDQQTADTSVTTVAKSEAKEMKIELNAPRMFLSFKKPYLYELRAYIYQARSLLSMDHDSFSDPYAQVGFINQSQRTEVIQKSLCPTWDQTLIFSDVELYGEPDEIHHDPPNILIELFDKDQYGAPDFLGRVQCSPIVRLTPDETKPAAKLKWFPIKRGRDDAGELLAVFELFLLPATDGDKKMPPHPPRRGSLFTVPTNIRPQLVRTGIEILCWGVRNMKTFMLSDVDNPQVVFEVGGREVESTVIKSTKKTPNFDKPLLFLDVMLPKEDLYAPPMNIKVKDHRSFGRKPIVGFNTIKSLEQFRCDPKTPSLTIMESATRAASAMVPATGDVTITMEKKSKKHHKGRPVSPGPTTTLADGTVATTTIAVTTNETETAIVDKKSMRKRVKHFLKKPKSTSDTPMKPESKLARIQKTMMGHHRHQFQQAPITEVTVVEEDIDWWSKYYASKGELNKCGTYKQKGYETLTIFPHPLESHELYEGFSDFCCTFQLSRGKTNFEEENEIVGEFKGLFKVYPLPEDPNEPLPTRIMENLPSSSLEECIVRIYVIRAYDLQPKDSNGKSDPYIEIELGRTRVDNRDGRIPNTTNPFFGKMFEIKTVIPTAKDLVIRVKDWDLLTSDELIGQTTIDLENRLLSKYRATCGLPLQYNVTGPNQWRDSFRPRKILHDVCKRNNLPLPELLDDHSIRIGEYLFHIEDFEQEKHLTIHVGDQDERLALYILHKLRLCPEHVETRPLFNPLQPLIEQGRLELFVDIYPKSHGPPGPAFTVQPREPKAYILRCIIWNTSDVILQETSITGEKMSDIYVKGWMSGIEDDVQKTDIHYRSMDGEGNFNWRFVHNFSYLPAERCISVKKKEHFWSIDATESTIPPVLNLQVWDNDKFSADDFLGALTLDLNRLYKPAKDSDFCTLDILNDEPTNFVSLFDMRRLKGWWPCVNVEGGDPELTGKIELELEILSEEEARERPAGRGREEPNENPKLEAPQRPETSFLWFSSPYRTFKNIIWRKSKWYIIGGIFLICFIIFLLLFLWAMPSAIWSRVLHIPG